MEYSNEIKDCSEWIKSKKFEKVNRSRHYCFNFSKYYLIKNFVIGMHSIARLYIEPKRNDIVRI